jgi:thioesterase domain-containing protein
VCAVQPLRKQSYPLPISLFAMARENLERLLVVQPRGPYRLAGYCHGGLIALEMAHMLRARGEAVESLVIVDAIARNTDIRFYHKLVGAFSIVCRLNEQQRMNLFLRVKGFAEDVRGEERNRLLFAADRVRKAIWKRVPSLTGRHQVQDSDMFLRTSTDNTIARVEPTDEEMKAHFEHLVRSYLPEPYNGNLILFASEARFRESRDATLGWNTVSKGVKVRVLPGDHHTCITKHSPSLAAELKRCLTE